MSRLKKVTVGIPTYNRGAILLDTIRAVLPQLRKSDQLVIADQTRSHGDAVEQVLQRFEQDPRIVRVRLEKPSVVHAMNTILERSSGDIVVYLDDDVLPGEALIDAHRGSYESAETWCVAGQILQPWNDGVSDYIADAEGESILYRDLDFAFNSRNHQHVRNVVGCNFSVSRLHALRIGGFDQQYVGSAYRFETDFAKRIWMAGGQIIFNPAATLRHLKTDWGGTRTSGDHMLSSSPLHAIGDYYYVFTYGKSLERFVYIARRLRSSLLNRPLFRRFWHIPGKFLGEIRALYLGYVKSREGARLPFV